MNLKMVEVGSSGDWTAVVTEIWIRERFAPQQRLESKSLQERLLISHQIALALVAQNRYKLGIVLQIQLK
jgi:hypothetical protein